MRFTFVSALAIALALPALRAAAETRAATKPAAGDAQVAVAFTGGHDTDPRDHGRPVILVASALGVSADVFRDAFSRVHPAGPGQQPDERQVRENKRALLDALSKYGVTNDRLDEVSNQYRYQRGKGELWRHTPASAVATVRNGVVVGITVTDPGSGYSSPPTVSVPGAKVNASVTLAFGTEFKANGAIKEITLGEAPTRN